MTCDDDLKLFLGAAILCAIFSVLSWWIWEFRAVAAAQFGTLIGAAAMKMKGNS
jgi:hypothetical protein